MVDTLEKFESGVLDKNSESAKDFMLFKRELYHMYEIYNRSVWEHEMFSFNIERENLKYIYNANIDFVTN